jgi:hypothetical protein
MTIKLKELKIAQLGSELGRTLHDDLFNGELASDLSERAKKNYTCMTYIKVRKYQNEYMNSSHYPKYERKN